METPYWQELPVSGHCMKEIQTFFLFLLSVWIFLFYTAKPNPKTYSKEVKETFQENYVHLSVSVLKKFHCLVFCFCSFLASQSYLPSFSNLSGFLLRCQLFWGPLLPYSHFQYLRKGLIISPVPVSLSSKNPHEFPA